METLELDLPNHACPIHIGRDLANAVSAELTKHTRHHANAFLITDANVARALPAYRSLFRSSRVHTLPPGETSKAVHYYAETLEHLAANRIDRKGAIFALGGGVIGDLAGFAAATYLRGLTYYQIPTSLLAMVDSSVGGKTGINLRSGKNLAGVFWQPKAVFIDLNTLSTLPEREFAAGMAEVIKYGLLHDVSLFDRLEKLGRPLHPDHPDLGSVIRQCCSIKAEIVRNDEKETAATGGRALLNLGHTFAHAIENVAGYGEYLHGEAVAIGLVLAARLSEQTCPEFSPAQSRRIINLLERYALPTALRQPLSIESLLQSMTRDKKVADGKMRFIVMERPGDATTMENVPMSLIESIWNTAMPVETTP